MDKFLRNCQACRSKKPKEDLIKITKLQDGTIKINPNSKELGRSMYICKDEKCIKNILKRKRIKSALKSSNLEQIELVEQELRNLHF